MIKSIYFILLLFGNIYGQTFHLARIQYGGGGDWYCDPSSLPNLLKYLKNNTPISIHDHETRIKLTDDNANQYPYLYLTGHGNIKFNENEIIALRSILLNGAFLHVDDNYGLNKSFRREIQKVFPNKNLIELPKNHMIFNSYYKFPEGLPKIHEHDNKPPQAFGLFDNNRMILLYTYESDLGDGWEDASVHGNPWPVREKALKMGVNIIYYALSQ
tara:strand:+ start:298 stop:942 length:645 start_codon:yes stop_codon:yes gene_type:complete